MIERTDVVVLGGGIAGLAAAYRAQADGASVMVLEAGDEVGGVMRSESTRGFLIEHGPTSMAGSALSLQLLHELGLSTDIVLPPAAAKRRYIVRRGKMHALPSSPGSLLRTPLLSTFGKLRLLAEPLVARRASSDEESLGSLVRRRLGPEALNFFVDPFVSGVCAGDAERLSSRYTLRVLGDLEQTHGSILRGGIKRARTTGPGASPIQSLRHGMAQLPAALRRMLERQARPGPNESTALRLNTRVTRVSRVDDGWEVSCEGGASVRARAIVCALPAHALPMIVWPDTWRPHIERLSAVVYAPIATVALAFRRDQVTHPLDGFGVLFPSVEKHAILGTLFNSTMFEGRAPVGHVLMTAFVGGSRAANAPSIHSATQAALAELTPLLQISGNPVFSSVATWIQGIPQLEIGHHTILSAAEALEKIGSNVFFTGSYLSGVAIGDCLAHGCATGSRAAITDFVL